MVEAGGLPTWQGRGIPKIEQVCHPTKTTSPIQVKNETFPFYYELLCKYWLGSRIVFNFASLRDRGSRKYANSSLLNAKCGRPPFEDISCKSNKNGSVKELKHDTPNFQMLKTEEA